MGKNDFVQDLGISLAQSRKQRWNIKFYKPVNLFKSNITNVVECVSLIDQMELN
jgi:hypothetical protein